MLMKTMQMFKSVGVF